MITIPTNLANLLHGVTDDISASVGHASTSVSPILERNEAPFFSDYTDHGVKHVESVLRTCDLLIGDESWREFTRQDAAVLVLAVMAHDLGMLITLEGFRYLVDSSRNVIPAIEADDEPWPKLWQEFQLDARRFDGATFMKLTGSPEPVAREELDPAHFTERGIRIAGEFLRRHHHRLAHEIVLFGMPSENGRVLLLNNVTPHLKDLAGIVARSHGMSVRDCLESLWKLDRTAHREFRHIHPTFLMTLVRLADYLDLDSGRAPSSILAAKTLRSPISRREWWSHMAIVDCHSMANDPECLQVIVDPSVLPDVNTFAVVEAKIAGIQQELDASWAVLGEVYGRFPPLNRLALKIRRIRSDIRESSITCQLPFVPHIASLQSANADLLKLLIEPLYGDHPGIGIRELCQNAIDAVRELDFILQPPSCAIPIEREELEGDVVVTLEKDSQGVHWITIADRGTGMTWLTVCKYYLTAGASFRQSDVWKKRFTDDTGASQVLRSGRFGIGVLAAFLAGDRVHVSTRHVDDPEDRGVQFEFGLDDTTIEMRWVKRKVGTTVKIRTTESVVARLMDPSPYNRENWDWYCLDRPTLVRKDTNGRVLSQKYKLKVAEEDLPYDCHRIHVAGYQGIDWSYRKNLPDIVCNGILVNGTYGGIDLDSEFKSSKRYEHQRQYLLLDEPKLSIFDPDGRFPLTLARDQVARTPEEVAVALTDDICRNFIAYCLMKGPQSRILAEGQFSSYSVDYPGMDRRRGHIEVFFDTPDGFGLTDPWNLSNFSSECALLVRVHGDQLQLSAPIADLAMSSYGVMHGILSDGTLGQFDEWHRELVNFRSSECLPIFREQQLRGIRTLMTTRWHQRFLDKQRKFIKDLITIQRKSADWVVWTVGDCPDEDNFLSSLAEDLQKNKVSVESVTQCYFLPNTDHPKPGRIAQLWKEVIGGPIIPFDKVKRLQIIACLDKSFERHITEWSRSRRRVT